MKTTTFRSINESPRGFNHRFVIDHTDLTEAADDTTQAITLITLPAGSVVKSAAMFLNTPFEDASDAAFDATTLIVGDSGDTDRYLASTELNENGTEILAKAAPGANIPHAYAAATAVTATFGSMAAKALEDLDVGEVSIYLETSDLSSLT
jgi:hypothetical protein